MTQLQPNETTIKGSWVLDRGNIVADDVCQRIHWLIQSQLEYLATDSTGWYRLFRDPNDNRLWECAYPQSELHGGGPPQLTAVLKEDVDIKYHINNG